jgi:hypothetical protein
MRLKEEAHVQVMFHVRVGRSATTITEERVERFFLTRDVSRTRFHS